MVINLKNHNIKKALKIAKKTYKVKCVFRKRLDCIGSYSHKERTMLLYVGSYSEIYTVSNFISTVFHELGHAHCYDNNVYPEYHLKDKYYVSELTKKEVISYINTAWRAEKYVDKWAKKEMAIYFPKLEFWTSYASKDAKKELIERLKEEFKN